MICVIQRVQSAQVLVKKTVCAEIGVGLLALVGIERQRWGSVKLKKWFKNCSLIESSLTQNRR